MNTVLRWGLVLALVATMTAQTAPKKKKKVPAKPAEPAVTQQDVQTLKDTLTAQQQALEALKGELAKRDQNWQDAQQKLAAAQAAAEEAQKRATAVEAGAEQDRAAYNELSGKMADVQTTLTSSALTMVEDQKRLGTFETALGRYRFTGDVRVRGENFNQQSTADRNRARIRARFGFEGKLGDFTGGLSIASGSLGDPTSTNETLTNNFDRKTVGLDRAFVTYNPSQFKALQLTGGKFVYPWIRTGVTFDPDLNPEGFSEKLSFDLHNPVVKNVSVGAYELTYNEVSGGPDSYALGVHGSAKLQPFPWWTATASFSATKWNKQDAILRSSAFAVAATSASTTINIPIVPPPVTGPTTTPTTVTINLPGEGQGCQSPAGAATGTTIVNDPVTGLPTNVAVKIVQSPPCIFSPNGMTNGLVLDSKNVPHFASGFLYADFILNNQFKTPWKRFPLNVVAEYENNLDAAAHPLSNPNSTTGVVTTFTSLGKQSHAYYADISLGSPQAGMKKGDITVGYAWLRQEQDSAIASFVESDQRAPTNILQHRFYALYKLNPNTVAAYTFWRGRTLNTALQNSVIAPGVTAGLADHYLNRLQFDIIYSF